jgi:hypothetical protein
MSVTPAPAYPLPRPANNADTRFSLCLAFDVATVLTRHGYPALTAGADLIRLQQAPIRPHLPTQRRQRPTT